MYPSFQLWVRIPPLLGRSGLDLTSRTDPRPPHVFPDPRFLRAPPDRSHPLRFPSLGQTGQPGQERERVPPPPTPIRTTTLRRRLSGSEDWSQDHEVPPPHPPSLPPHRLVGLRWSESFVKRCLPRDPNRTGPVVYGSSTGVVRPLHRGNQTTVVVRLRSDCDPPPLFLLRQDRTGPDLWT